jgi:molecular chaperone DnaK (HSP70)
LGVRRTERVTTANDRQSVIDFTLVADAGEGDGQTRKRVRVGVFDVPPQPAGVPRIEITFQVGGNGALRNELAIWATDLDSGKRLRVQEIPLMGRK